MAARATIGEFATMTRLSRKALRHYHEQGLLEPAAIDPVNGYRYYDIDQVDTARVIRRLRELDLPVPELKSYLAAPDPTARAMIVSAHLDRMRQQLHRTEQAVDALQALLTPSAPPRIEIREVAAESAVAISASVALGEIARWWTDAARELDNVLCAAGAVATGPLRGQYAHELFADERGDATIWFPVAAPIPETGRVRAVEIAGGLFAVAVHDGPDARLDDTYTAVGRYVADRAIAADGPVRERYLAGVLDDPRPLLTEIYWPVTSR